MQAVQLKSSMIESAEYDPDTQRLVLVFRKTHKSYRSTQPVPQPVFDALLAAPSAGSYYNQVIRPKYGMVAE